MKQKILFLLLIIAFVLQTENSFSDKTYIDEKNNYQIRHPAGWFRDFSDDDYKIVLHSCDKQAIFSVKKIIKALNLTPNNYIKSIKDKLEISEIVSEGELNSANLLKISCDLGYYGKYKIKNENRHLNVTFVSFKRGYDFYFLTIAVDSDYDLLYYKNLSNILSSFKILY